jgi:hypothetical protein
MWQGKGKTAIAGIGFSEISRRPQKPLGLLAVDACRAAIADAGLAAGRIDGVATYPESPFAGAGNRDGEDVVSVNWVMNHLALAPDLKWYAQIETGMIASPIIEAANALIAGACEYVWVWRALHRPQSRAGAGRGGPPRAMRNFSHRMAPARSCKRTPLRGSAICIATVRRASHSPRSRSIAAAMRISIHARSFSRSQ